MNKESEKAIKYFINIKMTTIILFHYSYSMKLVLPETITDGNLTSL